MNLVTVCLMILAHPAVEREAQGGGPLQEADRLIRRVEAQRAQIRKWIADDLAEWERMRREIEAIDESLRRRGLLEGP